MIRKPPKHGVRPKLRMAGDGKAPLHFIEISTCLGLLDFVFGKKKVEKNLQQEKQSRPPLICFC